MIRDINDNDECVLSCEIFPPKKEDSFPKVFDIVDRIAAQKPAFRV